MQPRLVAISYPSDEVDGSEGQRAKKMKSFRRVKSEGSVYFDLHTRISQTLRRFTWHDLKSQMSLSRRKRNTMDVDTRFEIVQPWPEAFLNDPTFPNRIQVNHRETSRWELLPSSVQALILRHIEATYNHLPSANAYSLRRRDVMAVQSSCKAWSTTAQRRLYETIQLKPNYDYDWSTTPPKIRHTRLLQLRRTLRSNPQLAVLVKHLMLLPENQTQEKQQIVYSDMVASIVMACPHLETLTSFHVPYTHNFNRLHHALASRTELTKHTWIVGEDEFVSSRAGRRYSKGILGSQQTRLFLHHHALWKNLEELAIISHNGKGILEHNLFVKTLNMLPSLKRLHVSSFDANDFSDETLLVLPPLESLRLDRCEGVTESGLCEWAESLEAANIQRLVLESQHITSLLTIATLLSVLPKLENFRMVQLEFEPSLPLELDVKQPLLTSSSLQTLEWFVAYGWDPDVHKYNEDNSPEVLHEQLQTWSHSKATQHILSSILDYGFPSLRSIFLPGYGNLSGLLRWVRHTSPVNQQQAISSELQRRATLKDPPHSAPVIRLRRDGSRLSLRPASPSFMEYDHWRKMPLFDVPEASNSTIPEISSPGKEEAPSFVSSGPISLLSTLRPSDLDSEIESIDDEMNDSDGNAESLSSTSSTLSRSSSPVLPQSPHLSDLSRSSTTTVRPESPESLEPVKKTVHFDLEFENAGDNVTKKFELPDEISRINCVPGWGRKPEEEKELRWPKKERTAKPSVKEEPGHKRHSSISILLDGYAYTA